MAKENPKYIQALKDGKAPLEYLVTSVLDGDARVHKSGADKYGIRNWTIDEIRASTYVAAIARHWKAWAEGQDLDPESGESHLYHIRACAALVLDAEMHSKLIDDRLRAESKGEAGPEEPTDEPVEKFVVAMYRSDGELASGEHFALLGPFDTYKDAADHRQRVAHISKWNGHITKVIPYQEK